MASEASLKSKVGYPKCSCLCGEERQQGLGEEKRNIGRIMKAYGNPVAEISKFTGMPPEEIDSL